MLSLSECQSNIKKHLSVEMGENVVHYSRRKKNKNKIFICADASLSFACQSYVISP